MLCPPQRPVVTLTFDFQNLIKSSVGASEYSLYVSSRLLKPFLRYQYGRADERSGWTGWKQCLCRHCCLAKVWRYNLIPCSMDLDLFRRSGTQTYQTEYCRGTEIIWNRKLSWLCQWLRWVSESITNGIGYLGTLQFKHWSTAAL